MSKKEKEELFAGAVLGVIALFILWVLWRSFGGSISSATVPPEIGGATYNAGNLDIGSPVYGIPMTSSGDGGCCCNNASSGCPVNASTVGTINQLVQQATAAANQIYAAGNATLATILEIGHQPPPLLQKTAN